MTVTADFATRLAAWCATGPKTHTARALELALEGVRDTVACMVAGATDEITLRATAAAGHFGKGQCSAVGAAERLSLGGAAFVNGAAAHIYDYDDNFFPAAAHASAVLVPAILAVGEHQNCPGIELLDAYIVGLEAMGRVGEAINYEHYERGWHATSTLGPIGAAAAVARLMGLSTTAMQNALSLSTSMAGGSRRQLGTMAKPLHVGLAAQHGILAAQLAASGLDGIGDPYGGTWGFRALYAGESSPGFDGLADKIGAPSAIEEFGLMPKIYPCCASSHATVDAVISLMKDNQLAVDDVAAVDTYVHALTIGNLRYDIPLSVTESRFSMGYAVLAAMHGGQLGLADFTARGLARESIMARLHIVKMHRHDAVRPDPIPANVLEPAEVVITTHTDATLRQTVLYARGVLQNPASTAQWSRKIDDCLLNVLDENRRLKLKTCLDNFEALDEVAPLMVLLRDVQRRAR